MQKTGTGFSHGKESCVIAGIHIGSVMVEEWNKRRVAKIIRMEVVDNHPSFNLMGQGEKITPEMLNSIVAYYRSRVI